MQFKSFILKTILIVLLIPVGCATQKARPYIDDKLFFTDEFFSGQGNGKELALNYYIFAPGDSVLVDVRLDHIDPSYYLYSISKQKYYQADGNPFAEPVQVYNNIQNGFGILGAYSRTSEKYSMFVGGWK